MRRLPVIPSPHFPTKTHSSMPMLKLAPLPALGGGGGGGGGGYFKPTVLLDLGLSKFCAA